MAMCRIKARSQARTWHARPDLVEDGLDLGKQGLHMQQTGLEFLYVAGASVKTWSVRMYTGKLTVDSTPRDPWSAPIHTASPWIDQSSGHLVIQTPPAAPEVMTVSAILFLPNNGEQS